MSTPGTPIPVLRPMSEAPITGPVVDVLVATTDRAGRYGWLIAHYAESGDEDQPPFKGWFFWTGFDFRQIEDKTLRGWIPLPGQPEEPGGVNLTKLADARAKMAPGEYELAEHDEAGDGGALHIVALRRHEGGEVAASVLIAIMPDDMRSDDNAAGLVAAHNAAPVLIEVARAAKVVSDQDGIRDAKAAYALRRALAKVSL